MSGEVGGGEVDGGEVVCAVEAGGTGWSFVCLGVAITEEGGKRVLAEERLVLDAGIDFDG